MTTITTGQDIDPRGVNHPSHYNHHPSGVEAIDLCRFMDFNVGSAFKYVYRRGEKPEADQSVIFSILKDLDKAIWYITDEQKSLPLELTGAPPSAARVSLVMKRVIEAEPDAAAKAVYEKFLDAMWAANPIEYTARLGALLEALNGLKKFESEQHAGAV